MKNFGSKLYLALGTVEFSAANIKAGNSKLEEYQRVAKNYAELFKDLDSWIDRDLDQRYDMATLKRLNAFGKKSGRANNLSPLEGDENVKDVKK